MKKVYDKLNKSQKDIHYIALKKISGKQPFILEAGTGWGKTRLAYALAEEFRGKRIIISTENNTLAHAFYNECIKVNFKPKPEIVIGKNNYIDIEKSKNVEMFFEDGKLKEYLDSCLNKKPNIPNDFLFENIFESVPLKDKSSEATVVSLSAMKNRLEYAGELSLNPEIPKITNHFYLLLSAFYGNEDFSNTILIIDEGDIILKTAVSLFSDIFSLFSFVQILKLIINNLKTGEERGAKTAVKSLAVVCKTAVKILNSSVRQELIGQEFTHDRTIFRDMLKRLSELHTIVQNNKGINIFKKFKRFK